MHQISNILIRSLRAAPLGLMLSIASYFITILFTGGRGEHGNGGVVLHGEGVSGEGEMNMGMGSLDKEGEHGDGNMVDERCKDEEDRIVRWRMLGWGKDGEEDTGREGGHVEDEEGGIRRIGRGAGNMGK
jgi:hypothetical protein